MIVKRYVKKSTIYIIFGILTALSIGALYLGIIRRFTYQAKYQNYNLLGAQVSSLEEYQHEDSDDNVYYRYSAVLTYKADGTVYTQTTEDIFSEDDVPAEGDTLPVFCSISNPNDYVVAKYDWMSKSYIPLSDKSDTWLFTAFLLIAFALILLPMNLENDQVQGILIGSGFLLFGLDGIVMGIIMHRASLFILLIFGFFGAIILFRYLFIPKERRQKADAVSAALRLFKVVDIYVNPQTGIKTVVFSMPENNGATFELFSYDDIYNQYNYGDMYQIDKTVLLGFREARQINGSYTIDINGLNPAHIQPLNPVLKKLFSRV